MTAYRLLTIVCTSILFLGLAGLASADSPPEATPTPADRGGIGPGQVQPAQISLDPATATAIHREWIEIDKVQLENPVQQNLSGQNFGTTALQITKFEDFEAAFPNEWQFFDGNGPTGGEQLWTDVPCVAHTGFWSGWPAGEDGLNGVNPCAPDFADYPNDVNAWLIYGPFNISGAQSASFNFYFNMITENPAPCAPDYCDFLFWGASTDGVNFSGVAAAGDYTQNCDIFTQDGDFCFASLDLTPLASAPQVWVAFLFKSDADTTARGPFIDDISVTFQPGDSFNQVFLPFLLKSPPPVTPKTNLYVFNNTGSVISSYRVFGSKLNGQPIPDVTCTNVPAGETRLCGTVDTGTYTLKFQSGKCTLQGVRALSPGNHTREARCPSNGD
ncbi:MAG: hypothetical protein L6R45_10690 [Anaerolineae bacterium]|nr:hypothetical protein [Anaerolineae bacterium]